MRFNNGRWISVDLGYIDSGDGEITTRGKEFAGESTTYTLSLERVETGVMYECRTLTVQQTLFI